MAILKEFEKQPGEIKFFDIHFEDLMAALATLPLGTPTVVSPPGIQQTHPATITDGVVRVWAEGGTNDTDYLYSISVVFENGWIEEQEIIIQVRETP